MAGDNDEVTGVDRLVNRLTQPSQKKTYVDYWNVAYRGFVPHGLNRSNPTLTEGGDGGPEPFDDTEQYITPPAQPAKVDALPVCIIDDFSQVHGSVESYFHAYQVVVPSVSTTMAVNRDPQRSRVRLMNAGPDVIYIGETESINETGYALFPRVAAVVEFPVELTTTRQIWATARTTAGATPATAILHVIVEYDKDM